MKCYGYHGEGCECKVEFTLFYTSSLRLFGCKAHTDHLINDSVTFGYHPLRNVYRHGHKQPVWPPQRDSTAP